MLKGAIHVHSTYSDGEFTLRELREVYIEAGCAFACVTDHAEHFDSSSIQEYKDECARLSDDRFVLVPGLEFGCAGRMHILGYGVTKLTCNRAPQDVIKHIEGAKGTSVIAHLRDAAFTAIESFQTLPDGIEAWNSKYDGRYAPRPGVFRLLNRLQERRPEMHAFYGQDLHWKKQFRGLLNVVGAESPDPEEILAAFARGDYRAVKDRVEDLPSSGRIPETLMRRFEKIHGRSDAMRNLLGGAKKQADRLGFAVPGIVKSHLRRIF